VQSITSAGTSLNQVPGVFKLAERVAPGVWRRHRVVLDYGGGKYDRFTEFLASKGITNLVFDPFNRPEAHNARVRQRLTVSLADVAVLANVLNVVREPRARYEILEDLASLLKPAGEVLITIHEGDRKSRGRRTPRGWQANRPTRNYLREVRKVFPDAVLLAGGKLIYAQKKSA
jgi:hypothetical protein